MTLPAGHRVEATQALRPADGTADVDDLTSGRGHSLRTMSWNQAQHDEFADVHDTDELSRRLLGPAGAGGGRSSHHDAVGVLNRVCGTGDLGAGFAALLICTSPRWDRVTRQLIDALEASGVLTDDELDRLADTLVADAVVFEFPAAWVSPEWLEIDITPPGSARRYRINEHTPMTVTRDIAPPLRRWSARRVLAADPSRMTDLLDLTRRLDPRDRGALVLGLLDANGALNAYDRRWLMQIGLATGMARVRCAALDLMTELDGAEAALRRAAGDSDAKVRAWRPRKLTLSEPLTLL